MTQSCCVTYWPDLDRAIALKPDLIVLNEPGQHLSLCREDLISPEEEARAQAWAARWGHQRSAGWLLQQIIKLRLPLYLDQDIEYWDSDQEPGAQETWAPNDFLGYYEPWGLDLWSRYGRGSFRHPCTPFTMRREVLRAIEPDVRTPEFWSWFTGVAWPSEFLLYGCVERYLRR